jgi:hypothetical protein
MCGVFMGERECRGERGESQEGKSTENPARSLEMRILE